MQGETGLLAAWWDALGWAGQAQVARSWGGQSRGISNPAMALPAVGVFCCTVCGEDSDLWPLRHAKL